MTREKLLAQADVLFWACADNVTKGAIHDRARELRAQAEAMNNGAVEPTFEDAALNQIADHFAKHGLPDDGAGQRYNPPEKNWLAGPALDWLENTYHGAEQERCQRIAHILRDLWRQATAHNNGAARLVEQSPGEVAPITGTAGSIPAAAPPSAAQPAAWMYQHEETGNANFRPHNERWVDHRRYVEIPLYTAPPDLAAKVEELEGLLREWLNTELDAMDDEFEPWINSFASRISAALAEGE